MSKYDYPMVECGYHQGPQRSYVVCQHITHGAMIASFSTASDEMAGEALCAACTTHALTEEALLDHLTLICAPCFDTHYRRQLQH